MAEVRKWIVTALTLVCLAGTAHAQETTTGSIGGLVTDEQGGVLPGVTVSVTAAQGAQTFVTAAPGRFFAPSPPRGTVDVRGGLAGFPPEEKRNVEVRIRQRAELNL